MGKCHLCNSDEEDEVLYGELLQKDNINVHLNCLYLTTCLVQEVNEDALTPNLYGFTLSSIEREAERIVQNYCCFCGKNKANITCCETKCRRMFHMVCGVKKNALYEFCGTFRSFCNNHGRKLRKRPSPQENCCICYDHLKTQHETYNRSKVLQPPCCHNGWFHKYCLQKYAKTAGYFFKCPLCNDESIFRDEVSKLGIFIMDRDAVWELESNAYHELLERPHVCSADTCINGNGREDTTESGFIMCSSCGHAAIHANCVVNSDNNPYTCKDCVDLLTEIDIPNETGTDVDIETFTDDDEPLSKKLLNAIDPHDDSGDDDDDYTIGNGLPRKKIRILEDSPDDDEDSQYLDKLCNNNNNNNLEDRNDDANKCSILKPDENKENLYPPQQDHVNDQNNNNSFLTEDEDSDHSAVNLRRRKSRRKIKHNLGLGQTSQSSLLNASCIASRTRRRTSVNKENSCRLLLNTPEESDESNVGTKFYTLRKRCSDNELDNSCIAKRTRRSNRHSSAESEYS